MLAEAGRPTAPMPARTLEQEPSPLGTLVGAVAHALRGELTGLQGGLYLLRSGLEKGGRDRIEKGLAMLERNARRIQATVDDCLYYLKEREPLFEPVPVEGLLEELRLLIEARSRDAGAQARFCFESARGTLEADPKMIRAMVANVVSAAIDATKPQGKAPTDGISFAVSGSDSHIVFRVEARAATEALRPGGEANVMPPRGHAAEDLGPRLFVAMRLAQGHSGSLEISSGSDSDSGTIVYTLRIPRRRGAA